VVMDNLACHKREGVRTAIEKAGAELRLLPAYSPDLNPIEKAYSKLKAMLRAAVAAAPDATLAEYRRRFALPLSRSALARALAALGLSRKKSRSGPASRTAPT